MKILFVIRSLEYGGAQRQLVLLANKLGQRHHTVIIAVFYGGGALECDVDGCPVRVVSLGKRSRWSLLPFLFRLVRLVRSERPDVVHGYLPTGNILATFVHVLCSGEILVWGTRNSDMDLNKYDRLERVIGWVERRLAPLPDSIVVNSRAGLDYLVARGFPSSVMLHIPNGIDTDRFRPDPIAGLRVRAELGIAGSEKLIGLIGRLDPMKGHATFLRAAAQLSQGHSGVRFLCLGDGPAEYRLQMQHLARSLGVEDRVLWRQARPDMPAVYNALDLLCSSSAYGEGFPNVVGEAMACGRSCVVTDVGDSRFVVGDTQIVVPPHSPDALAKAITERLAIGHSKVDGRQRVLDNFTIERLADRTEQILRIQCREKR